jgi:hypothetical protein
MTAKLVEIGKPFSVKIPNSRALIVEGNFSGEREANCYPSDNRLPNQSIEVAGQQAAITFDGIPIGSAVELTIQEDGAVLVPFLREHEESLSFRETVEAQYKNLFPTFSGQALVFDQCYYTRGLGLIEIASSLESKLTQTLNSYYSVFSGVGYGAIIALWASRGGNMADLKNWWLTDLKKATRGVSLFGSGRRNPNKLIKAIRKLFQELGDDLYLSDLKTDVFIPCIDISGRALPLTAKAFPRLKIYEAIACTILDPVEFNTNAFMEGYSLMAGDFVKSPVRYLAHNSGLKITNIFSPARVYDHSSNKRSLQNMAIIQKETQFKLEEKNGNITRYECKPIDNVRKFDKRSEALQAAIFSGQGIV